jgi:hypothetical protein
MKGIIPRSGENGTSGSMKFVIPLALMIISLVVEVSPGQNAKPDPTGLPAAPKTEEVPTPSGAPEPQTVPALLPGSNQLPAEPPDLRLPLPSILKPEGTDSPQNPPATRQLSPEEEKKNMARMAEIRAIAMDNARVLDLLEEAKSALTDEARREFMRAYYHTLCTRMRRLEPNLGESISAFERAEIRKLAVGSSRIAITLPRSREARKSRSQESEKPRIREGGR